MTSQIDYCLLAIHGAIQESGYMDPKNKAGTQKKKLCHFYFISKLVNILYLILQLGSTNLEDSKECFIKGHGNSLLDLEIDTAT